MVILFILLSAVVTDAQEDYPPGTFQLTPEIDLHLEPVPLTVPRKFQHLIPDDISLNLPPGFSAKVFAASGLRNPRFLAWSPDGVLFASSRRNGHIVALPDGDNNGVADTLIVAVDGLNVAHGLAFYEGDLYVADTHQILRYRDADGDHVYEQSEVIVEELPPRGQHSTRSIVFDEINEKLYVNVGSTCDICREEDPERATVLEFNADGSGRRIFARGLRNAVGLALHPITNELWATNNGHDREGVHLPPEWIDIVRDGGFYGWPLAYGYQVWTDFSIGRYEKALFPLTRQDTLDVEHMLRPAALVPAHLAPMGIHFYTDDLLPPQFRNAAFLAFRGGHSAGVIGYKVMTLFANPDGSSAQVADFLTGFSTVVEDNSDVRGKPVGITSGKRGSLYITSDERAEMIMKIVPYRLGWNIEGTLPDAILVNTDLGLDLAITITGLYPDGDSPVVTADLSELGGAEARSLTPTGDSHQLTETLTGITSSGARTIWFSLEQQTPFDRLLTRFEHQVAVFPDIDLLLSDDIIAPGWSTRGNNGAVLLDFVTGMPVHHGESALPVRVEEKRLGVWTLMLNADDPLDILGYDHLRLSIHPGDTHQQSSADDRIFDVAAHPGDGIHLLDSGLIDLQVREWQIVEVPLRDIATRGRVESIRISGNLGGTFYVDAISLIANADPPITAVLEERQDILPESFSLHQNYPNPFNSSTIIRFDLQSPGDIELAIYNLAGQNVATLTSGPHTPGSYTLTWDGRDNSGRELASGVYVYRFQSGQFTQTRKMALIR